METHAYIIASYPVLKKAAGLLGWIPAPAVAKETLAEASDLATLQRLKLMVEAKPQEGTHIINIRVVSEDAHEAARVANVLAQAYRDYNIQQNNKKTFETRAFIEEQLRLTSETLKQAEHALQAFREQNGLIALDAQTAETLNKLHSVQSERERIRAERAEIEFQLKALEAAGKGQADRLMGILMSAPPGSSLGQLRNKLSELNLKRQTLMISFTEKHPLVEEVTHEIEAVHREVQRELQSNQQAATAREAYLARRGSCCTARTRACRKKGWRWSGCNGRWGSGVARLQLKAEYQEVQIQDPADGGGLRREARCCTEQAL